MATRATWKSRLIDVTVENGATRYYHGAPMDGLDLRGSTAGEDALFAEIAAGGRRHVVATATRRRRQTVHQPAEVSVLRYDSLIDLREQLERLDSVAAGDVTCVLAVEPAFAGHVPSLVRRRHVASQLVLTTTDDPCPALDVEDLLASSQSFGWRTFSVVKDWESAVMSAVESPTRRCVVLCWPSWVELAASGKGSVVMGR